MNGVNDILWSPARAEFFLLAGQGLNLYKVCSAQELLRFHGVAQSFPLGNNRAAALIASNSTYTNIRSAAWCYEEALNLVAVGLSGGRTNILAFNSSLATGSSLPTNIEVQELVPRHSRPVHSVAWNAVEKNLLVTTLDKYRSDASILVWDISLAPWVQNRYQNVFHVETFAAHGTATKKISVASTDTSESSTISPHPTYMPAFSDRARPGGFLDPNSALSNGSASTGGGSNHNVVVSSRPLYEHGQSETVLSSCWFPTQARTLIAGFQNRGLRIIDLREAQRPARNGPTTKLIRGICIDRAQENRVAAYIDNACAIWDLRNAERSLTEFSFKRPVSKIEWCPYRPGLLAAVCRDANEIRLTDVQHSFVSQQECEPYVLERDLRTNDKRSIISFSWSPHSDEMSLLTTTTAGVISELNVSDRLTLAFSKVSNDVLCVAGNQIAHLSTFAGSPVVQLNSTVNNSTKNNNADGFGLSRRDAATLKSADFYYDSIDERNLDTFSRAKLNLHGQQHKTQRKYSYNENNNFVQPDLLNVIATRARYGYGMAPLDMLSNNIAALENACADSVSSGSDNSKQSIALQQYHQKLPLLWRWMQMIYQKYCDKALAISGNTGGITPAGAAVTSTGFMFHPVHEFSTFTGILSWISTPVSTQHVLSTSTVRQMPKLSASLPASESHHVVWSDSRITAPVRRYLSRERTRITDVCGWTCPGVQAHAIDLVDALADDGQYERAACIALFNLYIQKALGILQQASSKTAQQHSAAAARSARFRFLRSGLKFFGGESSSPLLRTTRSDDELHNLAIVAMALAGFATTTDESNNNTLWRDLARTTSQKISHPYLKAMFTFLYEISSEKYDSILLDERLLLEDRIAFAATYLSDAGLLQFLTRLTMQFVREANVEAMPLLGFSRMSVLLVQRYVDKTGDVQTAAALASLAGTDAWRISPYVANWVDSYRSLLDELRLWHIRATFDVAKKKLATMRLHASQGTVSSSSSSSEAAALHTRQIFASCSFCGKPVVHPSSVNSSSSMATTSLTRLQGEKITRIAVRAGGGGGAPVGAGGSASQTAVVATPSLTGRAWANSSGTTCPNCGKPLPRCTLCELHLGTPPASASTLEATDADLEKAIASKLLRKTAPIGSWFLWCQTCRHGGHTDHMLEWFEKYSECPVTGCPCRCASMDGAVGTAALLVSPSTTRPSIEFDTTYLNGAINNVIGGGGDGPADGGMRRPPPAIFESSVNNAAESGYVALPATTSFNGVAGGGSPGKAAEDAAVARERGAAPSRRNVAGTKSAVEEAPFLCGGAPPLEHQNSHATVPATSVPPVVVTSNANAGAASRQAGMVRR